MLGYLFRFGGNRQRGGGDHPGGTKSLPNDSRPASTHSNERVRIYLTETEYDEYEFDECQELLDTGWYSYSGYSRINGVVIHRYMLY